MQTRDYQEANNSAAQVRVVADISAILLFQTVARGEQKPDGIQPIWNRNRKVQRRNRSARVHQNARENNPAHAAGSSVCAIIMTAMNIKRKHTPSKYSTEINQ